MTRNGSEGVQLNKPFPITWSGLIGLIKCDETCMCAGSNEEGSDGTCSGSFHWKSLVMRNTNVFGDLESHRVARLDLEVIRDAPVVIDCVFLVFWQLCIVSHYLALTIFDNRTINIVARCFNYVAGLTN